MLWVHRFLVGENGIDLPPFFYWESTKHNSDLSETVRGWVAEDIL